MAILSGDLSDVIPREERAYRLAVAPAPGGRYTLTVDGRRRLEIPADAAEIMGLWIGNAPSPRTPLVLAIHRRACAVSAFAVYLIGTETLFHRPASSMRIEIGAVSAVAAAAMWMFPHPAWFLGCGAAVGALAAGILYRMTVGDVESGFSVVSFAVAALGVVAHEAWTFVRFRRQASSA